MKFTFKTTAHDPVKTDLLIIFVREKASPNFPGEITIPPLSVPPFEGKEREMRLTDAISGPAFRVLLIGVGDSKKIESETLRRCGAMAVKKAEKIKASSATIWFDLPASMLSESLGQSLVEGIMMGSYQLSDFQTNGTSTHLRKITIHGNASFNSGSKRGKIIGEANCLARRLQDTPGNLMRPVDLVDEAKNIADPKDQITLKSIDEKGMTRLGMGALLSVSNGSSEPAYMIHLIYKPKTPNGRKVCLVGKGLTFDAGGISLKPSAKMDEMKYDMSGGAAVLGAMAAIGELEPGVEVHGLVPTSENLPDGKANKPGDLVTAMNGLTIEVLNTDAEGRLILADALSYAEKSIKPDAMIDLATLTGAVVVGLGHEYSGVMGNSQPLIDAIVASGETTGELVWPLPLHDQHTEEMKGSVGDLKNISNPGVGAGSSTGGAFLQNFVGEIPWVHLDIAGSAWGASSRDYQGGEKGTGVGVRLLVNWIESLS